MFIKFSFYSPWLYLHDLIQSSVTPGVGIVKTILQRRKLRVAGVRKLSRAAQSQAVGELGPNKIDLTSDTAQPKK